MQPIRRETIGEPHPFDIEMWPLPQGKMPDTPPDPALVRRVTFTYTPRITSVSLPGWLRFLPRWALLLALLLLLLLVALAGGRSASARPAAHFPRRRNADSAGRHPSYTRYTDKSTTACRGG